MHSNRKETMGNKLLLITVVVPLILILIDSMKINRNF